ncbi:MAG: hypothetical protein DRQ43_02375 [Gammaproteobacteria bacterium]|nr:MAG: hypothetical protein DRQ43_02375 [Gammaproteobacteria bacterium]
MAGAFMSSFIKHHPVKSFFIIILIILIIFHHWVLSLLGHFLVHDQEFEQAEVAVVLNTGSAIYPRLIEAADLYTKGKIKKIVINGNRKTEILKKLEAMGYQPANPWYEDYLRIFKILGVPGDKIITISGDSVYDTVSEAELVGHILLKNKISSVVITTSKSHTKRAAYIWHDLYSDTLTIYSNSAKSDPYNPDAWWHDGRQIRWVMAEYGGWLFLYWKKIFAV